MTETHLFMSLRPVIIYSIFFLKGKFINSIQFVSFIPSVSTSRLQVMSEQNAGQASFLTGQVKKYSTCPVDKWKLF